LKGYCNTKVNNNLPRCKLSFVFVIALAITFGGMCMLPQHRGGACFCTRGAVQGYDVVLFILALAKTVTPVGDPGGSRGGPWRQPQNRLFSYLIVAPRSGNCIYRPVR